MVISNQIISFKLSGINYTGNSTQLNYTSGVAAGEAQANKTLVLDGNKSATSIGSLSLTNLTATSIQGSIVTAAQPNITSLGGLISLTVSGMTTLSSLTLGGIQLTATGSDINLVAGVTAGTASASKALIVNSSRNLNNINSLGVVDLTSTGAFSYKGTVVTADGSKINYIDTVPGTADANKALVLDNSRDISNVRNLTATSLTATTLSGTLSTGAQPNITSLGTLTSLNMSGAITGVSNLNLSGTLTSNAVSSTSLTGTLQTAAQPNVTSLGTLTSLNVSGNSNLGPLNVSSLSINSVPVNLSGGDFNYLTSITPGTASASKALVVNLNRDISNIRNLAATEIACSNVYGTIQTAAQSVITSVGTLTSLSVANTIFNSLVNESTSFASYLNSNNPASSGAVTNRLEMSNTSSRFGTVTSHPFRLMCNSNPLVSLDVNNNVSIGTVTQSSYKLNVAGSMNANSIFINGTQLSAGAAEINYLSGVTPGIGAASKSLVLDSNRSVNNINSITAVSVAAESLSGSLFTSRQLGINEVGTLTYLNIRSENNDCLKITNINTTASIVFDNGLVPITMGLATIGTGTPVANMFHISSGVNARLAISSSGNTTIGGSLNPNNYKLNVIGSFNATSIAVNSVTVTSTAAELNFLSGITQGTAAASKALILDASRDITNIRNLTATSLAGTLATATQPNVTSLGTLTSLTMSGAVTGVTDLTASGTVNTLNVNAINISGLLTTAAQTGITSVGTLTSVSIGTTAKIGSVSSAASEMLHIEGNNSNGLGMQIENRNVTSNSLTYIKFTGYNSGNDNYDLASIACGYIPVNANFGYGYLAFSTRNNSNSATATERMRITDSGNVGILKSNPAYALDVDGSVNALEFRLSGTAITSTAADLNRLSGLTLGTAAASKALVLDSSRDITNIRNLTATNLTGAIQTASQALITEIGTLINLSVSGPVNLTGAITINGNSNFSGRDIISVGSLSATTLTGTLQTNAQNNITSLGTLTGIVSSGNVKLGAPANPAQDVIHIEGSDTNTIGMQIENTSTSANSGTHIKFNGYNISNNNYDLARITCGYVAANANFGHGYLSFATRNVSTNASASERMRITESGSVGIGTSSPSQVLEVNGNIRASRILVNSSDVQRLASFLNPSMTTEEFITLGRSNTDKNQGEISFSYNSDGSDNNCMRFGLFNSGRRLTVRGNGFVGVNMPTGINTFSALHVNQAADSTAMSINYDAGISAAVIKLGATTNNKLFVEGGALFASSNTPAANGYVNINGSDTVEITNYGFLNNSGNIGFTANSGSVAVSLRTSNRIVAGQEIDVVSDIRLKSEIQNMDLDYCKKFIQNVDPKSYRYKSSDQRKNGFIAQDIVKQGFKELIGFSKEDVPELLDSDGFTSPAGQIFTVNYDGIIPILSKCIQDLYGENEVLKKRLSDLEKLIEKKE